MINILPKGITGSTGAIGATGSTGAAGSTGATGATGLGFPAFAYIFNVSAQTVAVEEDVTFDSHDVIIGGISHTAGSGDITLVNAGSYAVWYKLACVEAGQFTLFINGLTAVSGSTWGSGGTDQIITGTVIVTAAGGDVLELRNHSSNAPVTLQTTGDGTQVSTNASIMILKVS